MRNTSAISKKIQNSSTFGSFASGAMRDRAMKALAETMKDHVIRDGLVSASLYDHLLDLNLPTAQAFVTLPDSVSKTDTLQIARMAQRGAGISLIIDEPVRLEKEPILDCGFKIDKIISDLSFNFTKLSYRKIKSDARKRSIKPDSVAELIQAVQPPTKAQK